jgi:integrase
MLESRLKLKKHGKKADGSDYYVARGSIPVRQANGTIARARKEISIRGNTKAAREEEVNKLNRHFEELASQNPTTFNRAYLNYIGIGKAVPEFAEQLIEEAGDVKCTDFNDALMLDLRKKLFQPDASPSYVNRHLYTPVIAILNMALKKEAPELTRPEGHAKVNAEIQIPDLDWYPAVMERMTPTTRALTLFLTLHGRRLSEALSRRPKHFDPDEQTLIIGETKNGDPVLVELHPKVTEALLSMEDWEQRNWLFNDGPSSQSNVRKDIRIACDAAGQPYFSPHAFGRHAFATRMLRAGYSVEYVRRAGGWKTVEMVSRRYGHLAQSEVTDAVHKVADAFFSNDVENVGDAKIPDLRQVNEIK